MADKVDDKSTDNQSDTDTTVDDKKTNRTFSQSEFDSLLAKETSKLKDQMKDFDTTKNQLDELLKEKKEKELADMNEIDKATTQIKELVEKQKQLESVNKNLQIETTKSRVLTDKKFATLPHAYKALVEGITLEEIRANAEVVLTEYQEDLKSVGKNDDSFGIPSKVSGQTALDIITNKPQGNLRDKLKERSDQLG